MLLLFFIIKYNKYSYISNFYYDLWYLNLIDNNLDYQTIIKFGLLVLYYQIIIFKLIYFIHHINKEELYTINI